VGGLALTLHQITAPIIHKWYQPKLLRRVSGLCEISKEHLPLSIVELNSIALLDYRSALVHWDSHLPHRTSYPITTLAWIDGVTCSFLLVLLRSDHPETDRNKYS
jgi:hypothetical protein